MQNRSQTKVHFIKIHFTHKKWFFTASTTVVWLDRLQVELKLNEIYITFFCNANHIFIYQFCEHLYSFWVGLCLGEPLFRTVQSKNLEIFKVTCVCVLVWAQVQFRIFWRWFVFCQMNDGDTGFLVHSFIDTPQHIPVFVWNLRCVWSFSSLLQKQCVSGLSALISTRIKYTK